MSSPFLLSSLKRPAGFSQKRSVSASDEDFVALARTISSRPSSVILLSGGLPATDAERRHSLAAWDPFLVLEAKKNSCRVRRGSTTLNVQEDPLVLLDTIMEETRPSELAEIPPFCGGAVGYLAYDLKNVIERLPQTARDEDDLPDLWLIWPRQILIHDRLQESLSHIVIDYGDRAAREWREIDLPKPSRRSARRPGTSDRSRAISRAKRTCKP